MVTAVFTSKPFSRNNQVARGGGATGEEYSIIVKVGLQFAFNQDQGQEDQALV